MNIPTTRKPKCDFHLLSLIAFLLYLNFAPQRIELFLTEQLCQYPFPFAWLSASFLFLLLWRLAFRRSRLFDKRIKTFVSMVFSLFAVQLLLLGTNTFFYDSGEKGLWFQLLSMAYIYAEFQSNKQ